MVRFRGNGSLALGSDLFRYELLKRRLGCWIDADVFFLRALTIDNQCLFGWEDEQSINSAVLYLEHDSSILADLLTFSYSNPMIPPWWSAEEQSKQKGLADEGRALSMERLHWGIIGPKALTHYARQHGLATLARPIEALYPLHWTEARRSFDPAFNLFERFSDNTCAVHLWNHLIQDLKVLAPPPGSFLSYVYGSNDTQLAQGPR
jgi:hypothetical protein